jgi:hypothetical protein
MKYYTIPENDIIPENDTINFNNQPTKILRRQSASFNLLKNDNK